MAENIKIFMCTHKAPFFIPPLCIPIQGGAKIHPAISGTLPDFGNGGDISEKNPHYCELTVQYYAWKNEDADYYGFCHYRRFFCFDKSLTAPYTVLKKLSKKHKSLLGNEEEISRLVSESDVLVPKAEDIGCSVYKKYVSSRHCYKRDLDLFLKILKERYPFLAEYSDKYMNQNLQYFCNMFIMKKEIFFEYSRLLFSLLEEFDKKKVAHGNFQDDRTDGYLAERFLGIYIMYLGDLGKQIRFISRLDIGCGFGKRLLYKLFPPETKRRFLIKHFWHS